MSVSRNEGYLDRVIEQLYAHNTCESLDKLFSNRFGRPIVAWRLFRYLIRNAVESDWNWRSDLEQVGYPLTPCSSLDEFATVLFHEATHGCCHFLVGDLVSDERAFVVKDEEKFCWDVSQLVCQELDLTYNRRLAARLYSFHLAVQVADFEEIDRLNTLIPKHARPF